MQNKNDLTQGSIFKMLVHFAVPFMIANLLQSLYGAVDLFVVGRFCHAESVAAVSTGTQVTQIITSLITGLTVGSTVMIGNYIGKKDVENAKKTIGTAFSCFFIFGIILTVLMLIFENKILTILNTPKVSFDLTIKYVGICAIGNVFICEYNAISAILRGYGDSKSPMIFIGISCILNIILDVVFVKYCHMDVMGTAIATVISQSVSVIIAVIYLKKIKFIFDFKLSSFKIHKYILKDILKIGIPVSVQELLIRISFLYIAFAMNSCGLFAASVVGIGSKYDVFAMLTSNSMASALTAITAQNMGANKPERAKKALIISTSFAFCISFLFFLWAQISPQSMIKLFTDDINIINTGIPYFKSCSYDYLMVAIVFCLNGYLNGKRKTIWTMLSSSFSAVILRIPMTYIFINHFTYDLGSIGMIAPIVSAITAIYTIVYVIYENKISSSN